MRTARRLAGVLEYVGNDGQTRLLAMLQAYVANQGDGWTYSLEYVRRHLEQYRTTPASDALPPNAHEAYLALIRVLALRTAELHRALGRPTNDAAFSPLALSRADIDAYRQRALDEARGALDLLAANVDAVPAADRERANCRARAARTNHEAHRGLRGGDAAGQEDPHSRRLSPGPGSGHPQRLRHHRFRGRTWPQPGAAARETLAAARRRRDDALLQLCAAKRLAQRRAQ